MRKLYTLYEGPYRIRMMIRPNTYVIENLRGFTKGVYNARQIRPHRAPKWILKDKQREEDGSIDSNEGHRSQLMESESSYRSNSSVDTEEMFRLHDNRNNAESETDTVESLISISESEIQPLIRMQEHIKLREYK